MAVKTLEAKGATIIDAAIDLFRTGFPNPERHGCPSPIAIGAATRGGMKPRDAYVLEHLTCCSPCFVQFERVLEAANETNHANRKGSGNQSDLRSIPETSQP